MDINTARVVWACLDLVDCAVKVGAVLRKRTAGDMIDSCSRESCIPRESGHSKREQDITVQDFPNAEVNINQMVPRFPHRRTRVRDVVNRVTISPMVRVMLEENHGTLRLRLRCGASCLTRQADVQHRPADGESNRVAH